MIRRQYMNFFNVNYVWGARVIRVVPAGLRGGLTDSYNSSGETSADRTPLLPTAVFDSAQRYPTPELNYEISPIPPPRGLSHTFWSVQRWEIGLNKEGLHSAK